MNGIVNKKIGIAAIGITILVVLIGAIFVISTKGNNEVDLATTNTETNENNDTETVVTNDTIKNKEVENNTTKVASANVVNDTKNTTTNKITSTTSTGSNKNNAVVNKSNTTTTNKNTSTSSNKNTTTTKPSTNNTTKKPTTTTTTKKHVHNSVGTMGWFNSYDELVAAYNAERNKWKTLWKTDKISDEEYYNKCPIGYTNTHGCFAYIMHESDHDCGLVTGDWMYRNK